MVAAIVRQTNIHRASKTVSLTTDQQHELCSYFLRIAFIVFILFRYRERKIKHTYRSQLFPDLLRET